MSDKEDSLHVPGTASRQMKIVERYGRGKLFLSQCRTVEGEARYLLPIGGGRS